MVNLRGSHQKKKRRKKTCKLVNSHLKKMKKAPQLLLGKAHSLKQANTSLSSPNTSWNINTIVSRIRVMAR